MPAQSEPGMRLYVYIRTMQMPLLVDFEFPSEELAQRYHLSISRKNPVPLSVRNPRRVAVELPRAVTDLETSGTLQGFILHFQSEEAAAWWADSVCLPVEGLRRQLMIRQYWDAAGLAKLNRELPLLSSAPTTMTVRREVPLPTTRSVPLPTTTYDPYDPYGPPTGRAGPPPQAGAPLSNQATHRIFYGPSH